ncbi:unnamed protein product [Rotaria socialis]
MLLDSICIPSLYVIKGIIILDIDGNRLLSKYYSSGDVILLDNWTIVYRNNVDLLFYVMGSTNENELMLNSVLTCLFDSLSTMLRKNVEKRHLYDNLDLVMLTFDEICDDGIILETDPILITQRVRLHQDDIPLSDKTVSQVLSHAKEQLKRSLPK